MPSPRNETTLAILLGASQWEDDHNFSGSHAFANAVQDFEQYLCSPEQFGLCRENVLNLFNTPQPPGKILDKIKAFLKERIKLTKENGHVANTLLFYFVGHADFAQEGTLYCLAVRGSSFDHLEVSGLPTKTILRIFAKTASQLSQILIFDCCFAASAYQKQAGGSNTAARRILEKEIEEEERDFGTYFLCSSGKDIESLITQDGSYPLFSKGLLQVLQTGDPQRPNQQNLSIHEVAMLTERTLRTMSEEKDLRIPEYSATNRQRGDIAKVPLFPNFYVEKEGVRLAEEEHRHVVETPMLPQLSQTIGRSVWPQTLISPSTGKRQQPKELPARLSLTKGVIRGTRLLACWIVLAVYWVFLGYVFFLWIFPKRILHISGSTNMYMFLRGDFKKTEMLKILIVFFSLTFDWFVVGTILSHFSHLSLFTVQDVLIYGPILTGIFICLLIGYIILYYIVRWPYTNAINIRKTMEIIVVMTLLTFISPSFGASFLYFPLFTGVISLCLFTGGLVSLGGTQHQEDSGGLSTRLERRLQIQLTDERQSEEYFKERKKQR